MIDLEYYVFRLKRSYYYPSGQFEVIKLLSDQGSELIFPLLHYCDTYRNNSYVIGNIIMVISIILRKDHQLHYPHHYKNSIGRNIYHFLDSEKSFVVKKCLVALGMIGYIPAIPKIIDFLIKDENYLRGPAIESIAQYLKQSTIQEIVFFELIKGVLERGIECNYLISTLNDANLSIIQLKESPKELLFNFFKQHPVLNIEEIRSSIWAVFHRFPMETREVLNTFINNSAYQKSFPSYFHILGRLIKRQQITLDNGFNLLL